MTESDTPTLKNRAEEEPEPEREKHIAINVPLGLSDLASLLNSITGVYPDAQVTHDYRSLVVYTPKEEA